MFKNSIFNIFFNFILILVVILAEVLGCSYPDSLQNTGNSIHSNSFFIYSKETLYHTCDASSTCSHALCHSNHFCNAEIVSETYFIINIDSKAYSVSDEQSPKKPDLPIFLRPPILVNT